MKRLMLAASLAFAFAAAMPRTAGAESKAAQTKDEYVKKARADIDELSGKIDALERKAKKTGSSAHAELDKNIKDLKARRKTAKSNLAELKQAGGKAWADLKSGVDQAISDLKKAVDKVRKN
jgi:chromosome segregation ATPase